MIEHFHGNPMTTITACYSPTNVSEIEDIETFYEQLSASSRQIPKHNIHILSGDFNAHLGQHDGFKFSYHEMTNRNGKILNEYLLENKLISLNTRYKKRKGQPRTHKSQNGSYVQLDYIMVNKKWKNSSKNCRAYNSFVSITTYSHSTATTILSFK